MKARLAAAACAIALCLAPTDTAHAWVPYGFTWDPPSVSFNYNDGSFGSSGLALDSVRNHLTNATFTWTEIGCTILSVNLAGTTSSGYETSTASDGENVIYWESDGGNWANVADSTTYAMTNYVYDANAHAVDTDIFFNGSGIDDSSGNPLQWVIDTSASDGIDFESVAVHEMGHAIGLDHEPHVRNAIMYPAIFGGEVRRSLNPDDVSGVCTLYPNPFAMAGMSSECTTDHDCATGTCAFDGTNHFCAYRCASDCDCPMDSGCQSTATTGVSVCRTGAHSCSVVDTHTFAQNGASCMHSIECLSNLCYHPASGSAYCTRRCSSDCDCNAAYACDTTQSLCVQSSAATSCTIDGGATSADAGVGRDGGAAPPASHGGCAVSTTTRGSGASFVGLALLVGLLARRRRGL